MLSNYNMSFLIVHELQRSFRTDFFKPSMNDLLKDPSFSISFRFLTSLKSPYLNTQPTTRTQSSGKSTPMTKSSLSFHSARPASFHPTRFSSGGKKDTTAPDQNHVNHTWNFRKSLALQNAIAQTSEKGGPGEGRSGTASSNVNKNPDVRVYVF